MANIITTLHPEGHKSDDLYPNILKENIPDGAVTIDKLATDSINLINSGKSGSPSYVDTSSVILALTENKGLAVGTDTGHWYYWDGTHYVSGGVYQSTQLSPTDETIIKLQKSIKELYSTYQPLSNQSSNMINGAHVNGVLITDSGYDTVFRTSNHKLAVIPNQYIRFNIDGFDTTRNIIIDFYKQDLTYVSTLTFNNHLTDVIFKVPDNVTFMDWSYTIHTDGNTIGTPYIRFLTKDPTYVINQNDNYRIGYNFPDGTYGNVGGYEIFRTTKTAIKVEPNTEITFIIDGITQSSHIDFIGYDESMNPIGQIYLAQNIYPSVKFITPTNCYYINWNFVPNTTDTLNINLYINKELANKYVKPVKRFSIIGDSWSTFKNYIVDGNAPYYPDTAPTNNVKDVKNTWWYLLGKNNNLILDTNNSYSGSTIAKTNVSSFVDRYKNIGVPDIIFIEGSINDYATGVNVGTPKYSDWTNEDLENYSPALCYILDYYTNRFPNSKIVFLMADYYVGDTFKTATKTICKHYNVEYCLLQDISVDTMHPDINGMITICNEVTSYCKNKLIF